MEMEMESPQALCCRTDKSRSEVQGIQKTTTKAIQEVKALLQSAGLLIKVYDIWKHMKITAIAGYKPGGSQDTFKDNTQAQDIKDIKIELKELSKTVQGLIKELGPKGTTSYTDVTRNRDTLKGPTQKDKRVLSVPA
jgi:hypothetical protein